ncbi:hypothetical protein [Falsirhodobacter algicola]|uniref:Uncharacterized protein n=1 Tax=Falsirhodobacter algicola TaxID=2692330 RepID=A0A8J8MQG6_9RHOB|nr:hypothetical protein [Falsirhodobacter algicola]QUS34802.1 hypothetical protein GR316_00075 [Falsirhodobacter algicola]
MPQADLYYTADQTLTDILPEIERTIAAFDAGAGTTKGRAHAVGHYHHSHVLLQLSMLPKAHRDAAYAADLGARLAEVIRPHVTAPSAVAVNIRFDLEHHTSLVVE